MNEENNEEEEGLKWNDSDGKPVRILEVLDSYEKVHKITETLNANYISHGKVKSGGVCLRFYGVDYFLSSSIFRTWRPLYMPQALQTRWVR